MFGLGSIAEGIVRFFHGVAGSNSWTPKVLGPSSKISHAALGAALFVLGLSSSLLFSRSCLFVGRSAVVYVNYCSSVDVSDTEHGE
jgi:hypothetical protein